MKKNVLSLIAASVVVSASALDLTLYNAQRFGAEAKFVLRVIDQDGVPVAHARIFGGFHVFVFRVQLQSPLASPVIVTCSI